MKEAPSSFLSVKESNRDIPVVTEVAGVATRVLAKVLLGVVQDIDAFMLVILQVMMQFAPMNVHHLCVSTCRQRTECSQKLTRRNRRR